VVVRSGTFPSLLLFVFFALRAKKRTTVEKKSTLLPQAKQRLKTRPRKSYN